ncbi:MAG: cytidylate kinase-like family protein, partial [Cellulosilyticum sp.]|nr:cytidylate kinase-like family protein [Cellulosilyticum sp.]
MMKQKLIITVGRQYGSGGRAIGKKLAEALGISFYNREIIELAAKRSGMSEEAFEKVDETAASSLLYSIATGSYMFGNYVSPQVDLPLNDKLFIMQSEIIKSIAAKESCVIVGRCADYILKDRTDVINIFIHADKE